jgi:hypothetical protein
VFGDSQGDTLDQRTTPFIQDALDKHKIKAAVINKSVGGTLACGWAHDPKAIVKAAKEAFPFSPDKHGSLNERRAKKHPKPAMGDHVRNKMPWCGRARCLHCISSGSPGNGEGRRGFKALGWYGKARRGRVGGGAFRARGAPRFGGWRERCGGWFW